MNMTDSAPAGFKYFKFQGIEGISLKVRGYCDGAFEIKASWDGKSQATIPVKFTNVWTEHSSDINIPDGIQFINITYTGNYRASLASF